MDPVLAELYGTVTPQEDIEKTAQLDLLQKIAEAHDIDLDQLSDDQILEAVEALDGVEKVASYGGMDKEAEELFRNSDYGGRIFAHAMIDELRSIQKHASEEYDNPLLNAVLLEKEAFLPGSAQTALRAAGKVDAAKAAVMGAGRKLKERVGGAITKRTDPLFAQLGARESAKRYMRSGAAKNMAEGLEMALKRSPDSALAATGKQVAKRRAAQIGKGVAAVGGAAGAGAAGYQMGKKSFDEAVYERAAEHLAAAGLIDDSGEILDPGYSVKTAQDVDAAALGLLEQMGYPVEWY